MKDNTRSYVKNHHQLISPECKFWFSDSNEKHKKWLQNYVVWGGVKWRPILYHVAFSKFSYILANLSHQVSHTNTHTHVLSLGYTHTHTQNCGELYHFSMKHMINWSIQNIIFPTVGKILVWGYRHVQTTNTPNNNNMPRIQTVTIETGGRH